VGFFVSQKICCYFLETKPSRFLNFIHFSYKDFVLNIVRICGPSNILPFILASEIFGNFLCKYWKHWPSLSRAFTNYFIRPSLMWRRGIRIFVGSIKDSQMIFCVPDSTFSLASLFSWNDFFVSIIPQAQIARIFGEVRLLPSSIIIIFRFPQIWISVLLHYSLEINRNAGRQKKKSKKNYYI